MEIIGYYDLSRKEMVSELDSNGATPIPTIIAGEDIRFVGRFREVRDGIPREVEPNILTMKAHLGFADARPVNGTFKLDLNGEETTEIEFEYEEDTTSETPRYANLVTNLTAALEALPSVTPGSVEIIERNDSLIVVFPDDEATEQTFTVIENRIYPVSFLRIRTYQRGDRWEHEIRFIQAPMASTSIFDTEAAAIPEVYPLRDGGGTDGSFFSEIQGLYVPPTFQGTFRLVRDGTLRSDPLSPNSTLEEIISAVERLADPGGIFIITIPVDNTVYIEFGGDMVGIDFPLLAVEIFDEPPPSKTITLNTATREVADWMQLVNQGLTWLEVVAEIEDPDDEGIFYKHTLFRREVGVREAIDWDELATVPNVDWLNPPTHYSYNQFAPGQVSNGQLHYTTTFGDDAATVFLINHGLDANEVQVIITENQAPGLAMVNGTDYTWEITNQNQVRITWATGTPAANEYKVTVLGLVQTSFFDAHTHVIADVDGLQEFIDDILARLGTLEQATGGRITIPTDSESAEVARWTLPTHFELYPSRVTPTHPGSGLITDVDIEEPNPVSGRPIIGRGRGLLGAVHNDTTLDLPIPVPKAANSEALIGNVYQNNSGGPVLLPGGGGNRSREIKDGEYCTTNGVLWYPVTRYGQYDGYEVTADDSTDKFTFVSDQAEPFGETQVIQFETTGTLPGNISAGTDYTVYGADYAEKTFQVKDGNGDIVDLTSPGSGTLTVVVEGEITFYPEHFERTLFTIHVNDRQLQYRKEFDLGFHLEAAVLNSNTEAQWNVVIEIGEARGVTTEGTEGDNLDEIVWRKIPALEQRLILTPVSTTHRFGVKIARNLIDGVETLQLIRTAYGALVEPQAAPPSSGNFAIRARLTRFDVGDEEDGKGYVILSGLQLNENSDDQTGDTEYGFAVIK